MGFVYIFTNPCLDGWVKIGMTERDDISSRLNELNTPANIPLSFRCYAMYEVTNPREVEKCIHNLIDIIDNSLHAREELITGRIREREFFRMSPETAYSIFNQIACLRNDKDKLTLSRLTQEQDSEQRLASRRSRAPVRTFREFGISIGEKIVFLYNDALIATVKDQKNTVEYNGEPMPVSALAKKLLVESGRRPPDCSVNGWECFTRNSIVLSDLPRKVEQNTSADE